MTGTKTFIRGATLALCASVGLAGAALAQAATTSTPAPRLPPPPPVALILPTPGLQPVPGNPAASDIVSANDALVKAIAARNNGDAQTACTHATNATKAMALSSTLDRTHSAKMYADLKALACAAKPK